MVLEYQRQLQLETEARPDTFIRYTYLKLLKESRSAVAPLLGADPGEVVFVPNATTGVNTVLRNLSFSQGRSFCVSTPSTAHVPRRYRQYQRHLRCRFTRLKSPIPSKMMRSCAAFASPSTRSRLKANTPSSPCLILSSPFPGHAFPGRHWWQLARNSAS